MIPDNAVASQLGAESRSFPHNAASDNVCAPVHHLLLVEGEEGEYLLDLAANDLGELMAGFFVPESDLAEPQVHIRSSNQDDTDGTSSIVLPCPSS